METRTDRQQAARQAALWLADPNALILDTETTGLDSTAEIVQLAVMDVRGNRLLDALIAPAGEISPGAAAIHGITADKLALAAPINAFMPILYKLFKGRTIIIYNAAYDMRILRQSISARGLDDGDDWADDLAAAYECRFVCAMELYARWIGEWSTRQKSYRWQRLPGGDHTAMGDCRATLAILIAMAGGEG